mgnify:CR=1 FL=1
MGQANHLSFYKGDVTLEEYRFCEKCGLNQNVERHHIVFKGQGGLDFPLNYKNLCKEHHHGNLGPHNNRKIDLEYKRELQAKLKNKLTKEYYNESELVKLLELGKTQAKKICKKFPLYKEGYKKEDIIRRIMGGRIYELDSGRI